MPELKPIRPAGRTKDLRYAIRDLVVRAQELERQGRQILYLNIGDPNKFDFWTPEEMEYAIAENFAAGQGYTDSMGLPQAREAVAEHARQRGYPKLTATDVLIGAGCSEVIYMCFGALLDPGDDILVPSPGYPIYDAAATYFSARLNPYELAEDDGWNPDIADIEKRITPRTKGIVIINPNNPTGGVVKEAILRGLMDLAARHNLVVFADEIYDQLVFDGIKITPMAMLTTGAPVITFNGLSKNYLAPGYRVGWAIFTDPQGVMKAYREEVNKVARSRLCAPAPQQFAVKAALFGSHKHIEAVTGKKLLARRDLLCRRLNTIPGLSCVKPLGTFYAFPRIHLPIADDLDFVLDILAEENVLFVHGGGFGQKAGTKHFRVVFLPTPDVLGTAFDRLASYMERLHEKLGIKPEATGLPVS